MPKILYIIRHGETDLNARGIVQGRGIDSDLNDTGRAQGAAFYKSYKDISFDHLYTSTLKRTHQTVKRFIETGLQWTQLAGLDELAWGIWEGKEGSEASISAFREMVERWQAGDYAARFEGGESPEEVEVRLREAMETIIGAKDEKTILICMHGRAMRLLLCILMNKPLAEMADFPHQNTTLYKLSYTDGVFDIIDFNNTDHLSS